jgi:hypothetical protein
MKQFKRTFSEILLPNKDYKVLVNYASGSTAHFTYCYNSVSGGYMGLMAETFWENIRGLVSVCPNFLIDFEENDYRKSLVRMGFEQVGMEKRISDLYILMSQTKEKV